MYVVMMDVKENVYGYLWMLVTVISMLHGLKDIIYNDGRGDNLYFYGI